jgi:ArsR family transcriptional regulator
VQTRKEGTSVLYSVGNPEIFELLDVARRILTSSFVDTQALLAALEEDESGVQKPN